MWTEISFGKHAGKTLPQVLLTDPDYFFWAIEQDAFFKGRIKGEANALLAKARNVRIPKRDPHNWLIEHFLSPDGKYSHFQIVEHDRSPHEGSSITWRQPKIDFRFVRDTKHYDKLGYKHFLSTFKHHFFGSSSARMTRAKCEAFFDKDDNFD